MPAAVYRDPRVDKAIEFFINPDFNESDTRAAEQAYTGGFGAQRQQRMRESEIMGRYAGALPYFQMQQQAELQTQSEVAAMQRVFAENKARLQALNLEMRHADAAQERKIKADQDNIRLENELMIQRLEKQEGIDLKQLGIKISHDERMLERKGEIEAGLQSGRFTADLQLARDNNQAALERTNLDIASRERLAASGAQNTFGLENLRNQFDTQASNATAQARNAAWTPFSTPATPQSAVQTVFGGKLAPAQIFAPAFGYNNGGGGTGTGFTISGNGGTPAGTRASGYNYYAGPSSAANLGSNLLAPDFSYMNLPQTVYGSGPGVSGIPNRIDAPSTPWQSIDDWADQVLMA